MSLRTALVTASTLAISASVTLAANTTPDFSRDVLPILSENCYPCHGPDEKSRKARLRLDRREDATRVRGGDAAIVPGDVLKSVLIERLTTDDADERMPPAESGKKLTPAQVEILERWIDDGAEYAKHWAYTAPQRPLTPATKKKGWARGEIDTFILSRLEKEGLAPSSRADARTLARRLSLDLRGFAPEFAEVEELTDDASDETYERLVDLWMASPHFGERISVYWLDLVRFADTTGIHADNTWDIYPFRDYVINAFNTDLEFDQFTREQLGGDLMSDATIEQRVASSYNRLNMITREGGSQAKEFLIKYTADRVRNASQVWLATSLGCAECHDHKFDPLSSKEFYEFGAFFADIQQVGVYGGGGPKNRYFPPYMPVPTDDQRVRLSEIDVDLVRLQKALQTQTPELDAAQEVWEEGIVRGKSDWFALAPKSVSSAEAGVTFATRDDHSVLVSGKNPEKNTYTVTYRIEGGEPTRGITALRLEVLKDAALPQQGPGRAKNGNFVLTEIVATANGKPVTLRAPSATFEQKGYGIAPAVDKKTDDGAGWAVMQGRNGVAAVAVFESEKSFGDGGSIELSIALHQNHGNNGHTIGCFRVSATREAKPPKATAPKLPEAVKQAIAVERSKRSESQRAEVAKHFRSITPLLAKARETIAARKSERKKLEEAMPVIMATKSVKPMETRVRPRGNWMDDSGEVVQPDVPRIFGELAKKEGRPTPRDRAPRLVEPQNPVVARVFVNRMWKLFFGRGLVTSLDDFGSQGELPSHPKLLDYLALEFIESGWSVKHVVKLIVLSETYRQSSAVSAEMLERDPYNELVARQGRFRLDAEFVRDNALRIAGLLNRQLHGPSARPYQPSGYYSHLNFPRRQYRHGKAPSIYRRSLYTHWQRQFVHPSMLAFDAPTRERCTAERMRSNTPLAALVLLNDPIYVEAARVFGTQIVEQGGKTVEERSRFAIRRAVSRDPLPEELTQIRKLVDKLVARFRDKPDEVKELLGAGDARSPDVKDADVLAEYAAWIGIARAVLNMHELITRH